MQAGLSTKNAPSPKVVLPFFVFSAFSFVVASIIMYTVAGNLKLTYLGPGILSMTHVFVLGWITSIIFGAMYQLLPVVMEVKLYSERLAILSFYSLSTGLILLAWKFYAAYLNGGLISVLGGSLVVISVILFIFNMLKSAQKSEVHTVQNRFIISSFIWLLITVSFGLTIVLSHVFKFNLNDLVWMKIHIQFGIIGWFLSLVVGVSSTLLPMFFISHKLNAKYLEWAYYLLNIGLIVLVIVDHMKVLKIINMIPVLLIVAGFLLFLKYNFDSYKKRLRRKLDVGMKHSVLAFILAFSTLIFGLLSFYANKLSFIDKQKMELLFAASFFLGFLSALILGQTYKTLPFIIWLKKYQTYVGKYKIPLPAEMHDSKVADIHYYTFLIAFISFVLGIFLSSEWVIKLSAIFYILTSGLYLYNVLKIILHKKNLQPLK